jgi:hypothetical protein
MTAPFVGRERALERLLLWLSDSERGASRICFVAGAAGAGKSALIEAFAARAQAVHDDLAVATGTCNAQTGVGDPYLPFLDLLQQLIGSVEARAGTVSNQSASRLCALGRVSVDLLIEYAPDLIGTFIPCASLIANVARKAAASAGLLDKMKERFEPGAAHSIDQGRIFESYTALIRRLAARVPLVLVIDDLQWADAASCALLFHLAQNLRDARVLLIGAYRASDVVLGRGGDRHPFTPVLNEVKRYHGDIVLDLDADGEAQRQAFVAALVDAEPNELDEGFRATLLRRTGGHALFAVELLRDLKERRYLVSSDRGTWVATAALNWSVLPSRVEGVIEERVGRLQEELRELLRVASVEGESFTVEIVAQISGVAERVLLKALSSDLDRRHQLVAEGNVEKVGAHWISHYRFVHALFQQYLYGQLGRRERMLLHGSIAALLEQLYDGQLELVTVQLAHHYAQAGEAAKAYDFSLRAARRALRIGACSEVVTQTDAALALVPELPPADRAAAEIDAQLLRGHAFRVLQGWDGEATAAAYARAQSLATALPPNPRTATILVGMWTQKMMHLDFRAGEALARELLATAERLDDRSARIQAHESLSLTCYWTGSFAPAITHGLAAYDLVDPADVPRYVEQQGKDPRAMSLRTVALCEWIRGDREAALEHRRLMDDDVAVSAHPFSMMIAQTFGYLCGFIERDAAMTLTEARRSRDLAKATDSAFYRALPLLFIAWAESVGGDSDGPRRIADAFRLLNANGGMLFHSVAAIMTAEAHLAHGAPSEALVAVDAGIECAYAHEELIFIAELHRTRSDVLRELGREAEARAGYAAAIEHARRQGARRFEEQAEAARLGYGGPEGG